MSRNLISLHSKSVFALSYNLKSPNFKSKERQSETFHASAIYPPLQARGRYIGYAWGGTVYFDKAFGDAQIVIFSGHYPRFLHLQPII